MLAMHNLKEIFIIMQPGIGGRPPESPVNPSRAGFGSFAKPRAPRSAGQRYRNALRRCAIESSPRVIV